MKRLNTIIVFLLMVIAAMPQGVLRETHAADIAQTIGSEHIIVGKMRQLGVTFSNDNSVTLLTSGQEKFDDMFEAIRQAKSSVHLEYFNFRNDSIANALFDLLAQKAAEGVEVRALYDAFGNFSNNRPLKDVHVDYQRSRGIDLHAYDPLTFPWLNHVLHRDHRKIVIIDGQVAYIGGMNVADYYIHGTEQVGSWRDMHCRLEGSEVNTLQDIFFRIWTEVTGECPQGSERFDSKYYRVDASRCEQYGKNAEFRNLKSDTTSTAFRKMVGIVNREPGRSPKIMRRFYEEAINAAQDSIKLINPYFTLTPRLKKALRNAAKRGVKVEIMMGSRSDEPITPDCGFYNLHKLMKHGVQPWIYEGGFHHTKIIMVDGKFCTIGSSNLDSRSLRWDYECNALIVDPNTTKELSRLFDADKTDSFKLTPERWKTWRSCGDRFVGWVGHLLAFVL